MNPLPLYCSGRPQLQQDPDGADGGEGGKAAEGAGEAGEKPPTQEAAFLCGQINNIPGFTIPT